MDTRYTEFLEKGTFFYAPTQTEFKPYKEPQVNSDSWLVSSDKDWKYYINRITPLAEQGWKIHITSTLKESQDCLNVVSRWLIRHKISFKFVPNVEKLLSKNSKYGDRASSGKFITIYPKDTKEFLIAVKELAKLTKSFSAGAYILNDKQWYDSNVFFRYGAFQEMYATVDGKKVLGIKNPKGIMVPDVRAPYYVVPDFITEPQAIISMTKIQNRKYELIDTSEFDKYKVKSALHFSNAGGVYKAVSGGRDFVMKEGRKEAGLDRLNCDGFQRLKNEAGVLKKLGNKPYVVNIYNYFEVWENNYLIEEYLHGRNLSDFIAEEFPFSNFQSKSRYSHNALQIIMRLKQILTDLHSDGYSLGDLQPNNVMILDNNEVKLIDLETSTSTNRVYYPGLQTPGFVLQSAHSFEEADWFALLRIARFLFLPIEPISDLANDVEDSQDISIEKNFGEEVSKILGSLKAFVQERVHINGNSQLQALKLKINSQSLPQLTSRLRQGVLDNLDVKSKSLIPGDIRQFTDILGAFSVAYGGFGGIMALSRTGDLPQKARKWAKKAANEILQLPTRNLPKGMFNGLAGISMILFEIDEKELSEKIFKKINFDDAADNDLSMFSGLSGIAMASLSLYNATSDNTYLKKALLVADRIREQFVSGIRLKSLDPFGIPNGLLGGWSGISLFMLQIATISNNDIYKNSAVQMLKYELESNISIDENLHLAQVSDCSLGKERLIPYLGEGSAGIALVMFEFNKVVDSFKNEKYQGILENLCNVDETYCSYTSGIVRGISGFFVLENAKKEFGLIDKYDISTLRNYLLQENNHSIISPGDYGYRCSMDLFTGNSGLLLVLDDLDTGSWGNWLPFIPQSFSNLFKVS